MSTGTCTVHSWNDGAKDDEAEPRLGLRLNQKLERDPNFYEDESPRRMTPSLRAQALRRYMH